MSASHLSPDSHQWFQPTHWTVVLAVSRQDAPDAARAREEICRTYWPPIYSFIRRRGYAIEDAQDLTQDFLVRFLQAQTLDQLDPAKGKFRSFLLVSLKNFLVNHHERACAAKRGGGLAQVALDGVESIIAADTMAGRGEELTFDRQWAMSLMERSLARLKEQQAQGGRSAVFAALKVFLAREAHPGEYASLSPRLAMSDKAIAMAVSRLRQQYRELVREEIRLTVPQPADVAGEMRHLLAVLNQ